MQFSVNRCIQSKNDDVHTHMVNVSLALTLTVLDAAILPV